jgi:hypothetical protein
MIGKKLVSVKKMIIKSLQIVIIIIFVFSIQIHTSNGKSSYETCEIVINEKFIPKEPIFPYKGRVNNLKVYLPSNESLNNYRTS